MENFYKLAPYIAWMAILMAGLPYWVRTVCGGILLLPWIWEMARGGREKGGGCGETILPSAVAGLAVFAVWIFPEVSGLVSPAAKSAPPHPWIQLFGSAFVIAAAEELFFRDWLYGWLLKNWSKASAFALCVLLFAVEHDKFICGAIAGIVYLLLYLRRGLVAAVIAHATTNLALGIYVILTGSWYFW